MYLNAIIFAKLQKLYENIDTDKTDPYFLAFAPTTVSFTNFDFNFLNPNASSGDEVRQNDENKMAFAQIANAVIRDPKIFQLNTDEMLQDAYSKVLNNAILIDTTISDEDKAAYNTARAILFTGENLDATPEYAKYKDLQAKVAALDDQIIAVNASLSQGDTASNQTFLQQKQQLDLQKSVLLNDWIINGNKNKIEDALKVVTGLNERSIFKSNFNNEIINLKNTFDTERTVNSNVDYLPTFCLPQSIYKYDFNGWKKISMDSSEITTMESDSKAFLGDDLYNAYSSASDAPVSKIEFEYLFVTVQRNWFKKEMINSPYWKFNAADNTIIVSDGANENAGILPAFIDKFIFVRRIMQYLVPDASAPAEVSNPAPATYNFSEIAKLKNISMLKTVQPEHKEVSKIRLTDTGADKKTVPFIMLRNAPTTTTVNPSLLRRSTIMPLEHKDDSVAAKPALASAIRGRIFLPGHIPIKWHFPIGQPQQPTTFSIVFSFTDPSNNAVASLDIDLTNVNDGSSFSALTDNTGKVSFDSMKAGSYHLQIQNNEIFEDFESTYNINAATTTTVMLPKRPNPKFDMWVLGCVNYQFPKLPNPLDTYTYS